MSQNQLPPSSVVSDIRLINETLEGIIVSHEQFELNLAAELLLTLAGHLKTCGATLQGTIVTVDNNAYRLAYNPSTLDRTVTFFLDPIGPRKAKMVETVIKVNHFGRVRSVHILWPLLLRDAFEMLPVVLKKKAMDR